MKDKKAAKDTIQVRGGKDSQFCKMATGNSQIPVPTDLPYKWENINQKELGVGNLANNHEKLPSDTSHELPSNTEVTKEMKIISSTNSKNVSTKRIQIFDMVEKSDPDAFNEFLQALDDEDDYVRCIAAKGLGKLGKPQAVDLLINSLKDESPAVRKQSASSLGRLGNIKARQPLIDALKDKDRIVRKAAKRALSKINKSKIKKESEIEETDEKGCADISNNKYINISSSDAFEQAELKAGPVGEDNIESEAIPQLVKCEDLSKGKNSDIESLIKSLNDSDQETRIKSIRLLRNKIKEEDTFALDPLIKSLSDESAYIRSKAAVYLGIIKDKKAIKPLELALRDNSGYVRKQAQEALKIIKNAYSSELSDSLEKNEEFNITKEVTNSNEIKKDTTPLQITRATYISNKISENIIKEDDFMSSENRELSSKSDSLEEKMGSSMQGFSSKISTIPPKFKSRSTEDHHSPILKRKNSIELLPKKTSNNWILKVNSRNYNLLDAISNIDEITYIVDSNSMNLQISDKVYLWESQCNGIVATATVISSPRDSLPDNEEAKFILDTKPSKQCRIRLRIENVLDKHINESLLIANPKLRNIPELMSSQKCAQIINQNDAKLLDSYNVYKNISKERNDRLFNEHPESLEDGKMQNNDLFEEKFKMRDINHINEVDCHVSERLSGVKVISLINLKGGVGKTSITLVLAEFLTLKYNKNVLIIDLDPQTNATVSLISEQTWLNKNERGETLYQLFKDKLDKTALFDINKSIMNRVSNINGGIDNLSLLPSSIDLIKIQDSLSQISAGHFYITSPITILKDATSGILNKYDFVLIDCPPNLGIITLNGIYMSDYYLIPTIPDHLSTWGIPQITNRIKEFKDETNISILPMGIVISMYRMCSLHNSIIDQLKQDALSGKGPRIFDTIIPLRARTAEAAEYDSEVHTLRQKYGGGDAYQTYDNLTKEVLKYA